MTEEEIQNTDLYTIYKLIDVHAKFNNPRHVTNKQQNNTHEESDAYIDNITF